jgi:hypothetical protein
MILGNFSFQENLKSDFFYKIRKFGKLIVNDFVNHSFTFILSIMLNYFWATAKVFTNVNYYNGMELTGNKHLSIIFSLLVSLK